MPHAAHIPQTETLPLLELLHFQSEHDLSDLHLTTGKAPYFRNLDGRIIQVDTFNVPVRDEDIKKVFSHNLSEKEWGKYEEGGEANDIIDLGDFGRFRTNLFTDQHGIGAVLRLIKNKIYTPEEYEIPEFLMKIAQKTGGLILITGKNNSGKTTFLMSLIDYINATEERHIMVLEDPIEHVLENKKSIVTQRQIGTHSKNFDSAMEQVLREDVDVIAIGELRTLESINTALRLAETGYLVFGTLHTANTKNTLQRIIDVYPAEQRQEVLTLLSFTLEAAICQKLIRNLQGKRSIAREYFIPNDGMRSLMRNGQFEQMENAMAVNQDVGNRLFRQSLEALVTKGVIDEEAMRRELEG